MEQRPRLRQKRHPAQPLPPGPRETFPRHHGRLRKKFLVSKSGFQTFSPPYVRDSHEPQQAPTKVATEQQYDAAQIDKLEGLEAVRKRPGMYIGDPDERGLHHCVFEVLDNSIDEHLAGYCSRIKIAIHVDGSVSIADNGRGIPVDMHPKFGMPAVELVLTNLHAGGKFGQGAYKYSGGLHGVGAKCVNALADWFRADIMRNGKIHRIGFERGKTTQPLHVVGEVRSQPHRHHHHLLPGRHDLRRYHRVQVRPPRHPPARTRLPQPRPHHRPRGRAPGIREKDLVFLRQGHRGIRRPARRKQNRHPRDPVILNGKRQIELDYDGKQTTDDVFADVVFQYNDSYNDQILCFANSIPNGDGGTHLTGFRTALTRAINQYSRANKILKDKDPALTGDDVREGLVCVISVKDAQPALLLADQGQARQHRDRRRRFLHRLRGPDAVLRRKPGARQKGHREIRQRRPRPRSRPQGPRNGPQIRPLRRRPARQARRLLGARPREIRTLHCRR
jgi:DNA gyrase subunit B